MNQATTEALELQASVNLEFFYWMSIGLILIHAGFLADEGGAARVKERARLLHESLMTLAVVIPSFFFVGWFLYNAMPTHGRGHRRREAGGRRSP